MVIIGAGLAGLTCARALQAAGADCVVLDLEDAPGGRVRTDEVDGYRLDRGFQVLLTAYPTARAWLDYPALRLGEFAPGARVATPDGPARVSDPWRKPTRAWESLAAPLGTLRDKLRIGRLRLDATRGEDAGFWERANGLGVVDNRIRSTAEELARRGFTDEMLERFLRPWLGGTFLDRELSTPAAMMFFVYRMFARGAAALPAGGMGRIPEQLAAGLRPGTLRLGTRVRVARAGGAELASGEVVAAREVVVATEAGAAWRLGAETGGGSMPAWRRVTCVQWAAESSPLKGEPILWLNGRSSGLVNNVAVPSDVAEGYAPKGKSVVSVTVLDSQADVLGDEVLVAELREELAGYFGEEARGWRALAVQRIHRALPVLRVPNDGRAPLRTPAGLWVCGDHVASASIEGAMASGQAVADALVGKSRM